MPIDAPIHTRKQNLLYILLVAVGYFLAARLGLLAAFENTNSSPIWPPSGIAFAFLILLGPRIWPGITLGAFTANLLVFLTNEACDTPTALWVSAVISVGNTLEGIAGYYILRRLVRSTSEFQKVNSVFLFGITSILMCTAGSAIGPAAVCLSGIADWHNYYTVWVTWFMGDWAGILVFTPVIVIWARSIPTFVNWKRTAEATFLFIMVFITGKLIFSDWASSKFLFSQSYLIIPLLLWAAFRFEVREVATAILISAAIAVGETVQGRGPFVVDSMNISLLSLQAYISLMCLTFLTLSLALDERKRTERALKVAHNRLDTQVKERTNMLKSTQDEVLEYQRRIENILNVLLEYSQSDFSRKVEFTEKGDELDAIAAGLNALGEEFASNIAELKQSEEQLKRNQQQLTAAQQLSHIGSWEWDLNTNDISWSDELYHIHGLDPNGDKITVEKAERFLHHSDKEHVRGIIEESKKSGQSFNMYYRIVLDDHSIRTLHARGEVIQNRNGKPIRMIGSNQDVTDRKREEDLENLAVAATRSYNSVVIADAYGRIEWVNDGFTKLTGYELKDVKNTHGEILRKGADTGLSEHTDPYEYILREKKPITYENKNFAKDGRPFWIITTMTPVLNPEGAIERIISIDVDITERKEMEEDLKNANRIAEHSLMKGNKALIELRKAKKDLEESMRVKEQFLANMSHEIRTPMNAIVGFTDIMLKTELGSEQRQYLEAIKTSGENLIVIINDILDISKLQSGKSSFEQIHFRLSQVLSTVHDLMLPRSVEKGVKLSSAVDNRIPEHLLGDPTRLNQILLNLIGNAIKFTEKGEIKTTIELVKETDKDVELRFIISDTGIGIPENKLASIFDEFTQATSDTTRKFGGSGLGLAIVKQLVEAQGGHVMVSSKVGKGSAFSFNLNFIKDPEEHAGTEKQENYTVNEAPVEGLKILLVEDNLMNQMLARKVLTDWHWDVEIAENGLVALQKCEDKDYDLVLMDIQLPEMDGYEATRQIRNSLKEPRNRVPIMAMTAHAMSTEEEKCRKAGMDGYISKPFDQKVLYRRIVDIIKMKSHETHQS